MTVNSVIQSKIIVFVVSLLSLLVTPSVYSGDLKEVKESGVLKHLGIPYANFVSGLGDGLDVELMQGFADHLGVQYKFVPTQWQTAFGDLTGQTAKRGESGHAEFLEKTPIKGDVMANGLTILAWRQDVVDFSTPTFPSGVWLMARAASPISPITPTGDIQRDILQVKDAMNGREVLALENSSLDPRLYELDKTGAKVILANRHIELNEMAPAILSNAAETSLLDVPDALIALDKWHGDIKVIGPVSEAQFMGVAFRKSSPQLRAAFNAYFAEIKQNGEYKQLVQKYYPTIFAYFDDFFNAKD